MKIIEKYNSVLDKIIGWLCCKGYSEVGYTNLYIQRLINLYSPPKDKVLADYNQVEITEAITTTEPAATEDVELTVIEHTTTGNDEQTPKRPTLV